MANPPSPTSTLPSTLTSALISSSPSTTRPPKRPTAMPISAAAIFFITSGLLTISLLYRLIHLFRGLHLTHSNPTLPLPHLSRIPIPDLLFTTLTYPAFLTATYFCITIAQRITEFGLRPPEYRGEEAENFNTEATVLECLSIFVLCVGKSPVLVVAEWITRKPKPPPPGRGGGSGGSGGLFVPPPWLRWIIKMLPWPHIVLHSAALGLNAALPRSVAGIVVELAATVVSDLGLLLISGVLLLHPVILGRSTVVQRWGGWAAWMLGGFEMLSGIARAAVSVRVGGLKGLERWSWTVCEREERRVLMVALQTGCAVVAGGVVGFRGVGGAVRGGENGPGAVGRGERVGLGVWRVEEAGKGKQVEAGLEGRKEGRRSTFWG